MDGDIVAVELLPKVKWSTPSEMVLQDDGNDEEDTTDVANILDIEKQINEPNNDSEKIPTGKIVGIIRRKWRQYCGILQSNAVKGVRNYNKNNMLP